MLGWAYTAENFTKDQRGELTQSTWEVVKMQYKASYAMTNFKHHYKVSFTQNSLAVSLEKNQCGATVQLSSNSFKIAEPGGICSTMCCDSPLGSKFAQAITSKLLKRYQIKDNQLIIKDKHYTFWLEKSTK